MTSKTTDKFSPEVQARAVRMVLDQGSEHLSRWAAIEAIAPKIGCSGILCWMGEEGGGRQRQASGVPTGVAEKLKSLDRGGLVHHSDRGFSTFPSSTPNDKLNNIVYRAKQAVEAVGISNRRHYTQDLRRRHLLTGGFQPRCVWPRAIEDIGRPRPSS